jgi:hypothetical protein
MASAETEDDGELNLEYRRSRGLLVHDGIDSCHERRLLNNQHEYSRLKATST